MHSFGFGFGFNAHCECMYAEQSNLSLLLAWLAIRSLNFFSATVLGDAVCTCASNRF